MHTISKHQNSFGDWIKEKITVISINDKPLNVRGRTSYGNWAVDFIVPSTCGNGQQQHTDYFWRKTQAMEFINEVRNS
jgi:hypothetical protein